MNLYGIKAIYLFEMARFWRTLMQSVASPVLSTSLYFIVFGSAIGSRMVREPNSGSMVASPGSWWWSTARTVRRTPTPGRHPVRVSQGTAVVTT